MVSFLISCTKNEEKNHEKTLNDIEILHDLMMDSYYRIDSVVNSYQINNEKLEEVINQFYENYEIFQKKIKSLESKSKFKKLVKNLENLNYTLLFVVDKYYPDLIIIKTKNIDSLTELEINTYYELLEKIDNHIFSAEQKYQQSFQEVEDELF